MMVPFLVIARSAHRFTRAAIVRSVLVVIAATATLAGPSDASSLGFFVNDPGSHDYGLLTVIPAGFGSGEFTVELWIKPDSSFPVGPTTDGTAGQLTNWSDRDNAPYSTPDWWFKGNFLLDGHNNSAYHRGTFSLQFYGGGRLRWLFGDGIQAPGSGGHWSVGAYPASAAPSLLDGRWHQVTLVRRWSGASSADLELWIDGRLVASTTSPARTDMRAFWNAWPGYGDGQAGWFWGSEKLAAIGTNGRYEDFKGLLDEMRFWSRAKSPTEIASGYATPVSGAEPGLVGNYSFNEGVGSVACNQLALQQCIQLFRMKPGHWSPERPPLTTTSPAVPTAPTNLRIVGPQP
jgi:hypothetical protein